MSNVLCKKQIGITLRCLGTPAYSTRELAVKRNLRSPVIRGLPALVKAIENVGQFAQGSFRFSVQSVLADSNLAAVVSHNTAKHGSKSLDLAMVLPLRIEDERVVEVTEFPQQASGWLGFWS